MTPSLEQVFQTVQGLPLEDQWLLRELIEPPKSLSELALEQGVKPFDFAEARRAANFWPEEESVDDFLTALREWRHEGSERELE